MPGVGAVPERRVGRQRGEGRQPQPHRVGDPDRGLGIGHADVDVEAGRRRREQAREILLDHVVARLGDQLRLAAVVGMDPGAEQADPGRPHRGREFAKLGRGAASASPQIPVFSSIWAAKISVLTDSRAAASRPSITRSAAARSRRSSSTSSNSSSTPMVSGGEAPKRWSGSAVRLPMASPRSAGPGRLPGPTKPTRRRPADP